MLLIYLELWRIYSGIVLLQFIKHYEKRRKTGRYTSVHVISTSRISICLIIIQKNGSTPEIAIANSNNVFPTFIPGRSLPPRGKHGDLHASAFHDLQCLEARAVDIPRQYALPSSAS